MVSQPASFQLSQSLQKSYTQIWFSASGAVSLSPKLAASCPILGAKWERTS